MELQNHDDPQYQRAEAEAWRHPLVQLSDGSKEPWYLTVLPPTVISDLAVNENFYSAWLHNLAHGEREACFSLLLMSLRELRQVNFVDWQNTTSDTSQMVLSRLNAIEASPLHSVNVPSKPLSKLNIVRLRHSGPHIPSVGPVHDLLNTVDETYLSLSTIR